MWPCLGESRATLLGQHLSQPCWDEKTGEVMGLGQQSILSVPKGMMISQKLNLDTTLALFTMARGSCYIHIINIYTYKYICIHYIYVCVCVCTPSTKEMAANKQSKLSSNSFRIVLLLFINLLLFSISNSQTWFILHILSSQIIAFQKVLQYPFKIFYLDLRQTQL